MEITTYTSYSEIRTTVGLSDVELSDSILESEIYANVLRIALRGVVLPTGAPGTGKLEDRFAEIVVKLEANRTDLEQELYDLTRLFSTYVVAHEVAVSLSMRAPKAEGDGKRTLVRFSPESTHEQTAANIKKLVEDTKLKLESISSSAFTLPTMMSVVTPAVDVVTNS